MDIGICILIETRILIQTSSLSFLSPSLSLSLSLVSVSFALFLAHGDDGGLGHVDDDDLEGGPDDGGRDDDRDVGDDHVPS